MSENSQKTDDAENSIEIGQEKNNDQNIDAKSNVEPKKEKSLKDQLAESEDKLLRSLAEIENQRRRFEKEIRDAFEYGSFNFAKESLSILDKRVRGSPRLNTSDTDFQSIGYAYLCSSEG